MKSKSIAAQLGETGICACPNFLSQRALAFVVADFERLKQAGEFRDAATGRGEIPREKVRTDSTHWLNRDLRSPAQNLLWRRIDLLQTALNRALFLGLNDFEGHYASYGAGGFYGRHKDCFRGDSGRVVSFVLYLNPAWMAEDGGRLRIYARDAHGRETHTDHDPVGGTLICFMSAESEHEVLVSHKARFSLSGWFKRKR